MNGVPRIPFAEAITARELFAKAWSTFSPAQQAALKMFYGLPLSDDELGIWHALHGGGTFDPLGYLLSVEDSGVPYVPGREFQDITLIIGRRAAKTYLSGFCHTYEALLGGHKQYLINPRQDPYFLWVAQDLATAKANLRQVSLYYLESSVVGREQLGDPKQTVTADTIRLEGCGIITVGPPNIKLRSQSIPVCAMDEVGFWAKEKESAAPDYEVEAAVRPAMIQFPNRKLIKTSTPWTKQGLLWTAHTTGTYGRLLADEAKREASRSVLVCKGPSAVLNNPTLSREYLAQERAKDGDAFRREYLAEFADAVSGFLPVPLLHRAVSSGIRQRPPRAGVHYVATIDPAFRRDAFALCIGHMEADGAFVQDYVSEWQGTSEAPISPAVALGAMGPILKAYRVTSATTDQYHVDSLQDLALQHGFVLEFQQINQQVKKQIWGEVIALLSQEDAQQQPLLRLLDYAPQFQQLCSMERILTAGGGVRFSGKRSGRDDVAQALALCVQRARMYGIPAPPADRDTIEETTAEGCAAVRRQMAAEIFAPRVARQRAWWNR